MVKRLFILGIVSMVLLVPLHTHGQVAAPSRLRVALSTVTPHMAPFWVARDKGLFDKYGLQVEMVFVSGGTLVTQMLAAGEIQIAASGPAALLSLIGGGEKISAFLGISNTSPFTLVSQPNIKTGADLKGKRLGTARFGGSSHLSALIALEHLGLNQKRDKIILMQTGLDAERVAALERKGIDAAMLQRLATKVMVGKGFTPLLNLNQAKIPYQNTVLAARKDFMVAQPKVVESFTRAVIEGYAYVFNRENKQAVKEVIAKSLRLPSPEAAEDFYQEAQEELDRKPYPTFEGTRNVIKYVAEQNPRVAGIKAEDIIDLNWLRKLDEEGFFDRLYSGR